MNRDMNRQPDASDDVGKVPGEEEPLDANDRALLDRLASVVQAVDPVPAGLAERSLFAMTLAGLEAEVMRLQPLEAPAGAVRGGDVLEARTITFTHDRLTVMVALSPSDDGVHVRVDGWIAPAGETVVELRQPGSVVEAATDADGRFAFDAVDRGPCSLLVQLPDESGDDAPSAVTTPVVEI